MVSWDSRLRGSRWSYREDIMPIRTAFKRSCFLCPNILQCYVKFHQKLKNSIFATQIWSINVLTTGLQLTLGTKSRVCDTQCRLRRRLWDTQITSLYVKTLSFFKFSQIFHQFFNSSMTHLFRRCRVEYNFFTECTFFSCLLTFSKGALENWLRTNEKRRFHPKIHPR